VAVPVFFFIDASAGLPNWWRIYDCVLCFAVGVALVILCRRSGANEPLAWRRLILTRACAEKGR
jgi:hypothetical protein